LRKGASIWSRWIPIRVGVIRNRSEKLAIVVFRREGKAEVRLRPHRRAGDIPKDGALLADRQFVRPS
jgi:hypothetical protein